MAAKPQVPGANYNGTMRHRLGVVLWICAAAVVCAEDWQNATILPAVDLNALTPVQQKAALKLLRENDCPCGCGMKVAECRVKDPNCTYSKGLASVVVDSLKAGKSSADALAAAK